MVARINTVRSTAKPLAYNEEKVAQGKAQCIHTGNFLQSKERLTYDDKLRRFQRLNELNGRSQVKMFHATLNFSPKEMLSDKELAAIVDRYMQGLKMDNQPYLVYRHNDANHPHIHIVSSLIRLDGSRVNTHRMGVDLSQPTCKAIEAEFQLIPSRQRRQNQHLPIPESTQKLDPNSSEPVSEAVNRVVATVMKHYHFTNLPEYNAILRAYNVTAETGAPGSKTHRYNGLYYVALDDQGNRVSPPIMASQLPCRPTQSRLDKKYTESWIQREKQLVSVKSRIDWTLDQGHPTLPSLVSHLQRDGIEIVRPPANGRNPHDQIFVNHQTRIAVTGKHLGPDYTTAAFDAAIVPRRRPAKQGHQQKATPHSDARFSANVPQVLSATLHTHPAGPDRFGQDQHLAYRHKR
ncbi:MAG TPA: relaxase/mobilization nuclease domain-containing protein [Puia sp.]|uniref:relaxase/mobilization nuclease domain-containing protein n=1 Tax=Puia sp. TaxID=2045100 RepID=UPI002B680DA7|nr:relaxase/mobilization nuclease domain-containing protein [Puia sp.]HVU98505.1 relaxase/mobilization nuclease domain-containing protein [Puia sp.]